MPALNYTSHLGKRDENTGRNFSIIFAVIAFVIVIGCLFWGIFLPKYRKKHPPRPSPTRYNGLQPRQTFPSHPALLRGFRKHPSRRLREYNPRTQTPFPNTPPPGDSVSLPSLTSCNRSAQDVGWAGSGDGIFSPARDRLPSRRGPPDNNTLQQKRSHGSLYPDLATDDYILPVPELMALCPRPAGKAPTLARQLKRFPIPQSVSADRGKLAHPRKLFDDLEQRYSKTTTITSLETPSPMPLNTKYQIEVAKKHVDKKPPPSELEQLSKPSNTSPNHQNAVMPDRKCDTVSAKSGNIVRAGTITRPKTPVAEIRELYDGKSLATEARRASSPKSATVSSIDLPTNSTSSSYLRSGTPPTSPIEPLIASKPDTAVGDSASDDQQDVNTPTADIARKGNILSSMALPMIDRPKRMDTIHEGRKEESRVGRMFKSNRNLARPKPARLNLAFSAKSPAPNGRVQRHSMSSLSSLLMPLGKSKRPSLQASSVYSRDTRGVSYVRSPISPAFSDKPSATSDGDLEGMARKASSLDLLRSKIDNWDLHTAYLNFPTSPSSTVKRALSDPGPRSPTFPPLGPASVGTNRGDTNHQTVERTIPRICVGRPSDDIFRDSSPPLPKVEGGRVLKRVIDMEVAGAMASLTRSLSNGSAPGGAGWI